MSKVNPLVKKAEASVGPVGPFNVQKAAVSAKTTTDPSIKGLSMYRTHDFMEYKVPLDKLPEHARGAAKEHADCDGLVTFVVHRDKAQSASGISLLSHMRRAVPEGQDRTILDAFVDGSRRVADQHERSWLAGKIRDLGEGPYKNALITVLEGKPATKGAQIGTRRGQGKGAPLA